MAMAQMAKVQIAINPKKEEKVPKEVGAKDFSIATEERETAADLDEGATPRKAAPSTPPTRREQPQEETPQKLAAKRRLCQRLVVEESLDAWARNIKQGWSKKDLGEEMVDGTPYTPARRRDNTTMNVVIDVEESQVAGDHDTHNLPAFNTPLPRFALCRTPAGPRQV